MSPHPRGWLARWALLASAPVLLPALVIGLLRWVPPPTTAFIWERGHGQDACPRVEYSWVPGSRIPGHAALAVVAAEDQRFWLHSGFDMESIRDAMEARIQRGKVRGASTISQQVAKNLFLWNGRSWVRKGLEAYLTVIVEALWPKRRILEMYLNIAQFGRCTFGVGAAAQSIFGVPADRLGRTQSALLAAVLPNPRKMSAGSPSPYVRSRADDILVQMGHLEGSEFVQDFQESSSAAR